MEEVLAVYDWDQPVAPPTPVAEPRPGPEPPTPSPAPRSKDHWFQHDLVTKAGGKMPPKHATEEP